MSGDRRRPPADQRGDVLARLQGAEVGDVRLAVQAEPVGDLPHLLRRRPVEQRVIHAVVGHVDPGRVGTEHPDQLVPGRLGRHDQPARAADGGADRRLEERRGHRAVQRGLGEVGQVVDGDHGRGRRAQRHGVVRRVYHVRVHLLRDQRQAGLLPGQPGRAVRDRGRAGHDVRSGDEPGVPLLVGALTGHRQVRARSLERGYQPIDVAAERAAVGRNGGRVNKNTRRHNRSCSSLMAAALRAGG